MKLKITFKQNQVAEPEEYFYGYPYDDFRFFREFVSHIISQQLCFMEFPAKAEIVVERVED